MASPSCFASFTATSVQVAEHASSVVGGVVERADDLLRDDEDVRRRLRLDVVEREAQIVLVGDLRGDGLVDDLQEDVVREHVGVPGRGCGGYDSGPTGVCPRKAAEAAPTRSRLRLCGAPPTPAGGRRYAGACDSPERGVRI